MRIVWNENPLKTQVHLDAPDLKLLKTAIKYDDAYMTLIDISNYVDKDNINLKAINKVLSEYFIRDDADEYDSDLEYYIDALLDTHMGDCTCVPAGCVKCRAEDLLGINTIKGLSKYAANYIVMAFRDDRSISEALEYLKNYEPDIGDELKKMYPDTWKELEKRWKANADKAYEWLLGYEFNRGMREASNHYPDDIDWEEVAIKARGL